MYIFSVSIINIYYHLLLFMGRARAGRDLGPGPGGPGSGTRASTYGIAYVRHGIHHLPKVCDQMSL